MYNTKILSVYITNLGKYNEGELVGKWLEFPTTEFEIQEVLQEISIDNVRYEEFFITDYESDIKGLTKCLGEYENLYALNYLATKIGESDCTVDEFEALLDFGEYTGSIEELVTLVDNTDCFVMYGDVENDYDLGYYYIHETGMIQEMKNSVLANYIDYEAYGRDVRLEECGTYTSNGYYVCMIDSPDTAIDLWDCIQNHIEDMKLTA